MSAQTQWSLSSEKGLPGRIQHPGKFLHKCVQADDYETLKWVLKFDEGEREVAILHDDRCMCMYTSANCSVVEIFTVFLKHGGNVFEKCLKFSLWNLESVTTV